MTKTVITIITIILIAAGAYAQDGRWVEFDVSTVGGYETGKAAVGDGIVAFGVYNTGYMLIFDIKIGEWQSFDLNETRIYDKIESSGHIAVGYSDDILFGYSDIGADWDTVYYSGSILDMNKSFGCSENLGYFLTDEALYVFDATLGEWQTYEYTMPADFTTWLYAYAKEDYIGVSLSRSGANSTDILYSYHTHSFNFLDEGASLVPPYMDHGFAQFIWNGASYTLIGYSAYDNQFDFEYYAPMEGEDPISSANNGSYQTDEFTTLMGGFRYPVPYVSVSVRHFAYDTRAGEWVSRYQVIDLDFQAYAGYSIFGGHMAYDVIKNLDDDSPSFIFFDGTNSVYRAPIMSFALNVYDGWASRLGGTCFFSSDNSMAWGYNVAENLGSTVEWINENTSTVDGGANYFTATRWSSDNDIMRKYFYNGETNNWQYVDLAKHWNINGIAEPYYYIWSAYPENEVVYYSSPRDEIFEQDFPDDEYVSCKIRGCLGSASGQTAGVMFDGSNGNRHYFNFNLNEDSQNGLGMNSAVFCDDNSKAFYGYSSIDGSMSAINYTGDVGYCLDSSYIGLFAMYDGGVNFAKFYTYNSFTNSWVMLEPVGPHVGLLMGERTAVVYRNQSGYNSDYIYAFDPQVLSTDIADGADNRALPAKFEIVGNYPNPFNPSTEIKYSIPYRSEVSIEIFNILGQKVTTLKDNEEHPAGKYSVVWDGTDNDGRATASGVYFCRLKSGEKALVRKMLLVK